MKRFFGALFTLALALTAVVVAYWSLQNADQTAQLRLDLGHLIGAWQMARPMSVPALMGVSFGAGAVLTGVLFFVWGMTRGKPADLSAYDRTAGQRF